MPHHSIVQYQVDAFTTRAFSGNPAAVCPLDHWLDDRLLQAIAEENNLSETAFFVPTANGFDLRWFTPVKEMDLCGHATLASAHILFEALGHSGPLITFSTKSGDLFVRKNGTLLEMDFPSNPPVACGSVPELLRASLGRTPTDVLVADVYVAVFDSETTVRSIRPDHSLLRHLDLRAVVITAPGRDVDFVSRYFAPKTGIPEDPVTGAAHCKLAPYWAKRLGKDRLTARQVSQRGGDLICEMKGDRVLISGAAVTVMETKLNFEE
ncbi:MAG: PhzF family phenazine biosynthesis protein [Propionivibrio sp.]